MSERRVIVNADDFGLSAGTNAGISAAHQHGIVTSASLMVRWAGAAEAAAYGQAHPQLSLGLHVDLGEWAYHDETWVPLYEVVPQHDATAVLEEVFRQLATFTRLTGSNPTHLDSHQHVHQREPAHSILVELARQLAIPLRHYSAHVRYCGDFYGQTTEGAPLSEAVSVPSLTALLASLPRGVTELACHPGLDDSLPTMYRTERRHEVNALCDPAVRSAIVALDVELLSFGSIACGERMSRQ